MNSLNKQLILLFVILFQASVGATCNDETALYQIKEYFDTPGVTESIYNPDIKSWNRIDLNIFWQNVIRMENICFSRELEFLRLLCKYEFSVMWAISKAVSRNDLINVNRFFLPVYNNLKKKSKEMESPRINFCNWFDNWVYFDTSLIDNLQEMEIIVTKFLTNRRFNQAPKYNITLNILQYLQEYVEEENQSRGKEVFTSWIQNALKDAKDQFLKSLTELKLEMIKNITMYSEQLKPEGRKTALGRYSRNETVQIDSLSQFGRVRHQGQNYE